MSTLLSSLSVIGAAGVVVLVLAWILTAITATFWEAFR